MKSIAEMLYECAKFERMQIIGQLVALRRRWEVENGLTIPRLLLGMTMSTGVMHNIKQYLNGQVNRLCPNAQDLVRRIQAFERGDDPSPDIDFLQEYAHAVGGHLQISFHPGLNTTERHNAITRH